MTCLSSSLDAIAEKKICNLISVASDMQSFKKKKTSTQSFLLTHLERAGGKHLLVILSNSSLLTKQSHKTLCDRCSCVLIELQKIPKFSEFQTNPNRVSTWEYFSSDKEQTL